MSVPADKPQTHYLHARVDDPKRFVAEFRDNEYRIRRLRSRDRGRNGTVTELALQRRLSDRSVAELSAAFYSDSAKALIGALIQERGLLERLAWAREKGVKRPELQVRLTAGRQTIARLIREIQFGR